MIRLGVVNQVRRVLLLLRLDEAKLIQAILRHPETVQTAQPCKQELPALFHGNSGFDQKRVSDFPQVGLLFSGREGLYGRSPFSMFVFGAAVRSEELEVPARLIVHPKPDLLDPLAPDPQRERDQLLLEFPCFPLPQLHQTVKLQCCLDL